MKKNLIISTLVVTFAFALRYYQFEFHAPFDWDQNRDYSQVRKIDAGEYVPLGPVAKGSGGFYLGSLYYYLLYPGYFFMDGDLISLPLTSIVIDALVVGLIYLLLSKILAKHLALAIAVLWGSSWFLIQASRISWNVSLIPLWSLLVLFCFYKITVDRSPKWLYLIAFLAGITTHIHVTLFLVIPLLGLFSLRHLQYSLVTWVKAGLFLMLPLTPLILYDMSHGMHNLRLVKDFLTHHTSSDPIGAMITTTLSKLGKVTSGILFAKFADSILLGSIISFLSLYSLFNKHVLVKISGILILVATLQVILFRETGFPEYYLAIAYLPIMTLVTYYLFTWLKYLAYPLILALLVLNLASYSTTPSPFSLGQKSALVRSLREIGEPLDVHLSFDPGREGGFNYLLKQEHIPLDKESRHRIILTDKLNTPLYIEGELASDLKVFGNFKSAMYIVQ